MEKTKVAIYGASGHGKVLAMMAKSLGYEEIIFIDDGDNEYLSFKEFFKKHQKDIPVVLGIGENSIREVVYNNLKSHGCEVLTLIDSSAIIAQSVRIEEGVVIMPRVVINPDAHIKTGSILNSACVVEHDCHIGEFTHISPSVAMAGGVDIGDRTHIGIGAVVIQNIKIGSNVIVGAGSVVISDVIDDIVVAGNPVKKIRNIDE